VTSIPRAPDSSVPTCAAWNIAYLFAYAQGRGLSRAQLAEHFAVDLAVLDDVDGRLPLQTLVRMWNELPELVSDPDMPLHVVEHVTTKDLPLLALLFLASPTLADGFKQLERYQRVTHDLSVEPASRWLRDGAVSHVELYHERSAITPPTGAVIDAMLAMLLIASMATGKVITPLAVSLRHPLPRDPDKYHAAFRCNVQFEAARDRMTLANSDLALPHLEPSRTLERIAAQYADAVLATLPTAAGPLATTRAALRERLPKGDVSLAVLAPALGVSKRTLQRRLEQAGTNLRELVDEERKQLALGYIKQQRLSLSDIALLLGFSELSAFTRAFTRWTDTTPSEYRRAQR
jgi:AraC-like DNA-binding protein